MDSLTWEMYFIQCNVRRLSLSVLVESVTYIICWSVILSPQCLHPVFLQLQPLLRHQHSLPNKGWLVRSSDLLTWSVYSILALSSLANVIITKFFLWRNILYKVHLFLLLVVGRDVLAVPVLASRRRQCSCYLPSFRQRCFWILLTCGSGLNSLSV